MAGRANNFDLKLLTSSKEVGLRRLRSYAAALGGGASIFHSYEDLRKNLETSASERHPAAFNIVLHDSTLDLAPAQIAELRRRARIFILQRPDEADGRLPPPKAACWTSESYFRCSLAVFLDSPVVRMSMAQMCKGGQPFRLEHLLRWGHAASTWNLEDKASVADHGISFIHGLSLAGEGRRLTEMFSHFIQARLKGLLLSKQRVVFGSDGLLLTVIAHCRPEPGMDLKAVVEELKVHDFPIAVVNRLDGGATVEIAGLYYPFTLPEIAAERIIMLFGKELDQPAAVAAATLEKAG
jgi:hypothetical protein